MKPSEFETWMEYYRLSPFDDLHRYHRPAALITHSLNGREVKESLAFLIPKDEEAQESDLSDVDLSMFKAFGVKPPKK